MHAWSSNLPSRRSRSRSQSPKPSLADGAAIFLPPRRDPYSRHGAARKDWNTIVAGPSCPSTRWNPVNHRERLVDDRHPDQRSQAPQPMTPSGFVPSLSPPGFVSQRPIFLAPPFNHPQSVQVQHPLVPLPAAYPLTMYLQESFNPTPLLQPPRQYPAQLQQQNPGMFNQAHDFTVMGTFIEGNVTYNNTVSNQFMKELLEKTIPGAEFDSSDRDPPPRCHPGTRLAILERCLSFILYCDGQKKMRWVVGAAGVGKSAVMQSVAESPELPVSCHASVFFSINGRNDGTKAIITISYQLAVKSKSYRQLIEREITLDPSLLRSSMAKQFLKLIIEPFIHNPQLNSAGHVLIIIDGLDECNDSRTQLELLRLISDLCIKYPSSPLVWLIASRPETHIASFFSRSDIVPTYEKEEIPVNSSEARADAERFLRAELKKIKEASKHSVDSRWPEEQDFWKLTNASGGLFAYAHTVIRYIGDSTVGSPASQLFDVLNVIDNHPMTNGPPEEHPMALLDALYARILSKVPSKTMINTRKILLTLVSPWYEALQQPPSWHRLSRPVRAPTNLVLLCNWLGMTPEEFYAAINLLHSVLRVPRRDEARRETFEPFHKSFIDYISDFSRSGFCRDIEHEAGQLMAQCAFRILNQAPDGIDFGSADYGLRYGTMRRGPGAGDKISLAWPVHERFGWYDSKMKLTVYGLAIQEVVAGMECKDPAFQSERWIRLLTTQFEGYSSSFPFASLRDLVFDESRRHGFMMHGVLRLMPLKAVYVSTLSALAVKWQFCCRATTVPNLTDLWNSSCEHIRQGKWGEREDKDWVTSFSPDGCAFCFKRLQGELEKWKMRSPDHPILTLFTSTGLCCVEFRFAGSDGNSEWTYWFWCRLTLEERRKYGSDV